MLCVAVLLYVMCLAYSLLCGSSSTYWPRQVCFVLVCLGIAVLVCVYWLVCAYASLCYLYVLCVFVLCCCLFCLLSCYYVFVQQYLPAAPVVLGLV